MAARPSHLTDPEFGELTWNAEELFWEGECIMADGTRVPLCLQSLGYSTQQPPFEDATWNRTISPESRAALARVDRTGSIFRTAVSRIYLSAYPDWNDGEQISDDNFKARLKIKAVELTPDGLASVFFDDDGMFGGHALIAHLDPDGVVRNVEMFG